MEKFYISKVYFDNEGLKSIDINPLPYKICSFDCVFCPLGKNTVKTDEELVFQENKEFVHRLKNVVLNDKIQRVFINPDGEAFSNKELANIVTTLSDKGIKIKILSNGYNLNNPKYRSILDRCHEVIGEIAVFNEKDFQKLQRPLHGYTLDSYINNMIDFRREYKGKFVLDITIIKNYSDDEESIIKLREIISKIRPDSFYLETPDEDRLKNAFCISDSKLIEIKEKLINNM